MTPAATEATREALEALEAAFIDLRPENVGRLREHYAPDAAFRDPFNDVRGVQAIVGIFEHMFEQLESPRFVVLDRVVEGEVAWLTWNLEYRMRGGARERRIHGASRLRFVGGRVVDHRDYWDAAEELYETLPLLGTLLRALRSRLRAPQG
ncbi:MAG: nuclear transport factor 2 family protein [Pseudomonadota bacterium]